jgi:erythromycin esterase-like protein/predicted phosphoribosyltransferase
MRFKDRREAGRALAGRLSRYANTPGLIVLGLPRGGVPVAYEIAIALGAPLDVFVVRKLGVPGHDELAMGAIAAGGVQVLNEQLIDDLSIPRGSIHHVVAREQRELDRRDALYRGARPHPDLAGRTAVLVDDGLATGATMEAAVAAARQQKAARIIVAAPVGARDTCRRLADIADEVVCAQTPEPFDAVGLWYERFDQTTDAEVTALLAAAAERTSSAERTRLAERSAFPERAAASERVAATERGAANERASDPAGVVRQAAIRLAGDPSQYDALIAGIGDAPIVLLGEATHGTHEFYRERAFITRRLIEEKGFRAVAVEADWPDAYRVNRFVRGVSGDAHASEALADFGRFPTWMWRNADVLDFVGWLRAHNEARPDTERAGFYGLDLYSLRASMQAVLEYLDKIDPEGARRARRRYGCFDQFGEEMQEYGYAASYGLHPSCEQDVLAQLLELHRRRGDLASRDGRVAADEYFYAAQNARLVASAEEYYRTMFRRRDASWNLRDRHMADTLDELRAFLGGASGAGAKVVVWAHNSHLGDARATDAARRGELNVGQLVRERHGGDAVLVGFTTFDGTVTAASEWDGPAHRRHVRPALAGSYERLFHDAGVARFLLPLRDDAALAEALRGARLERAIGVLYLPESERASHYFSARLPQQFDYVLHFDRTRAVEPLERTGLWEAGEVAETYPTGL